MLECDLDDALELFPSQLEIAEDQGSDNLFPGERGILRHADTRTR